MAINFIINYLFIPVQIIQILSHTHQVLSSNLHGDPPLSSSPSQQDNDIGRIKSCASNNKKRDVAFESTQCSTKGIWVDRQLDPGCICVNGLWVLSSDVCDDDLMIIYGQGHCFQSNKKVQKLLFLGSPIHPFSPATFVGHRRGPFIFENLQEVNHSYIGNETLGIIRINPDSSLYTIKRHTRNGPGESTCLDSSKQVKTQLQPDFHGEVSILKLTTLSQNNILEFGQTKVPAFCTSKSIRNTPDWTRFDLELGQGLKFKLGKIIESSEKCQTLCHQQPEHHHHHLHREKRAADKPQVVGFYGWSHKADPAASTENLQRYVLEQNVRAIKAEAEFMKTLVKEPWQIRSPNEYIYEFLQLSRQLMGRVCSINLVDDALLRSISRIFRYITLERKDANLYGATGVDQGGKDRVTTVLKKCLEESQPWTAITEFTQSKCQKYVPGTPTPTRATPTPTKIKTAPNQPTTPAVSPTGSTPTPESTTTPAATSTSTGAPVSGSTIPADGSTPTGTAPPSDIQNCQCDRRVTGLVYNETLNSTCSSLNDTMAWTLDKHDLIVETIWKVFQFTHHYCARHFEKDGTDLSLYHERIERLFLHSDVLYRWYNPGLVGPSVWDFFYFGYDLAWFAHAMDACVCGAQSLSAYTEWMTRPEIPTFRRKRDLEQQEPSVRVIHNMKAKYHSQQILERRKWVKAAERPFSGKCLDDPWDPIKKFHLAVPESCTKL